MYIYIIAGVACSTGVARLKKHTSATILSSVWP